MPTRFDAIIIGAGPAGSSAAILLATAGWSVGLVEKQMFPRRKVCGECVAASNLPLLNALGVGDAFMARAGPELRHVALMQGTRTVLAALPAAPHPAWGRALGRETLDALLLERARAAGATVLQPWAVQKVSGVTGDHRCTVRDVGSNRLLLLQAPVAIFAHGSWEPLPAARAEQRLARSPGDLLAFKANFSGASLAAGLLPVLAFDGGYGGMVVADDGLVTLACCIRADRLEALRSARPGRPAGEVVEAMLRHACQGVADALHGAARLGPWLASGPLAPGVRLRSDDTVFRIGNAAGEAHPIIGEGMSMALQSAWLLCDGLVRAHRPAAEGDSSGHGSHGSHGSDSSHASHGSHHSAAWQRGVRAHYAARWRSHFVPRLRLAAAFAHLAMRPATASALIHVLARFPTLLTRGAAWSGKVACAADATSIAMLQPSTGGRA